MRKDSGIGCGILIFIIMIIIIPFKLGFDWLEKNELCYEYVPFCESKEESAERELEDVKNDTYFRVKDLAINSSPKKWHSVTEYKTKNGGYVYYLGTNSMNGIYLYWDGNVNNPKLFSLDYQAQEKLNVRIYEGEDRIQLMDEFLESEEAKPLVEESDRFINGDF